MFEESITKYSQDLLAAVLRIAKSSEENGTVLKDIRTLLSTTTPPVGPTGPTGPIVIPPIVKVPGPPANATRVWYDKLATMPVGPLPTDKLLNGWLRADQPNAMTEVVNVDGENRLQNSVWDIPLFGKSGSRGFFGGLSWNDFIALKGKMVWLLWDTLILQHIPLQSEQYSGVATIGPEGKMGETVDKKSLGIWGINVENIGGKLIPWIQNSSSPQWVFKGSRTPLPINAWYPNSMQMPWTFDLNGWQKYWYIDSSNLIETNNVRNTGVDGSGGFAFCNYILDNNKAIPPDRHDKFSVQFRNMSLWVEN